jgi:UDP-N-acetylmuramoyl-tripeptide--D-alanyl-D-alanine ligase
MIPLSVQEVVQAVGGTLRDVPDPAVLVTDVVTDSRLAGPGALFVAMRGERTDGHRHLDDALAAGATAVMVQDEGSGPSVVVADTRVALGQLAAATLGSLRDVRTVGVTGSNGKTTTKDLVASLLGHLGPTVASPASYNGEVGLPLSVLQATPETRYLVLEYGARGVGHIRDLTQIARPDISVVLGVGVAHVGVFGDRAAIAKAKGELVEALSPEGVAILNADDKLVAEMRSRTTARVVTFARDADADVMARGVTLDTMGRANFSIERGAETAHVQLLLYGEHQVTNALAAACVALECGLSLEQTAAALSAATPASKWRMDVSETANGVVLVNDAYNANPDSMAAGLRALVAIASGRPTWAVLGEMAELGDTGPEAHEALGRLVSELGIDNLVVVGKAAQPIADSAAGGRTRVQSADDVEAAAELVQSQTHPGDVVLVKASRSVGLERIAQLLLPRAVPA